MPKDGTVSHPVPHSAARFRKSEALTEAARNTAVVVAGRKVRHPCAGVRIGPVARSVLHRLAVPVAVVPHG